MTHIRGLCAVPAVLAVLCVAGCGSPAAPPPPPAPKHTVDPAYLSPSAQHAICANFEMQGYLDNQYQGAYYTGVRRTKGWIHSDWAVAAATFRAAIMAACPTEQYQLP